MRPMRKFIVSALLLLMFAAEALASDTLRLMTYNIRNTIGLDEMSDIDRTATIIREAAPSVIAVDRKHGRDVSVRATEIVPATIASDHRPVIVDLILPAQN